MKAIPSKLSSIALLILAGCGGGGSTNSDAISSAEEVSPPEVTETVTEAVTEAVTEDLPNPQTEMATVETTSDLVAASSFNLASHKKVSVSVDISGMNTNQGYLSVCAATISGQPNYEDCYLRTALPNGNHQTELLVATNINEAVSAIWFLDLSQEPVITNHDLSGNQLVLSL